MVIEIDSSSPELPTSRVRVKKSGLLVSTKETICDAIQNYQSTLIAHEMSAPPPLHPTLPSPTPKSYLVTSDLATSNLLPRIGPSHGIYQVTNSGRSKVSN